MRFEHFVARRFMPRGGTASQFSRPLTGIAVVGIALGVVVMVMAISILGGFRQDITHKVSGFGSHITITAYEPAHTYTDSPIALDSTRLDRIRSLSGVAHLQPYATKGGMVKTDDQIYGIMMRGYGDDWDTTFFSQCLVQGQLPHGHNDVLISTTISSRLGLHVGDKMRTYFWQGESYRPRAFIVSGLYNTDLTEMDELYVVGSLATVQRLSDWQPDEVGGYELAVENFDHLDDIAALVTAQLPYDLMLTTVRQAHPALFSWLDLLGANITLLLVIMALVSAVCIVSALLIMIFEKSATIGLLKALGANNASVCRIFLIRALRIVIVGVLIGDAISLVLSLVQQTWHPLTLDAESYSMSVVPVLITPSTYLIVSLGTVAVCLMALMLPTAGISHISPTRTMRTEK